MKVKELVQALEFCDPDMQVIFEEHGWTGGQRFYAKSLTFWPRGNLIDGGPILSAFGAIIKESNVPLSVRTKDPDSSQN